MRARFGPGELAPSRRLGAPAQEPSQLKRRLSAASPKGGAPESESSCPSLTVRLARSKRTQTNRPAPRSSRETSCSSCRRCGVRAVAQTQTRLVCRAGTTVVLGRAVSCATDWTTVWGSPCRSGRGSAARRRRKEPAREPECAVHRQRRRHPGVAQRGASSGCLGQTTTTTSVRQRPRSCTRRSLRRVRGRLGHAPAHL